MRTFVLGDVHGAYKALIQVLKRANFDYENDRLIALGDVCDGWSEVSETVEELLKIKNLIYIEGNHDQWFLDWHFNRMQREGIEHWFKFGGQMTVASYKKNNQLLAPHVAFFQKALKYYVDEKNRAYVHAGIPNHHEALDKQYDYCWTRHFYENATVWEKQKYVVTTSIKSDDPSQKVVEWFVGHTPVSNFKNQKGNVPLKYSNINFVDTGAAFDGVLSLMNVDTYEIFQSDIVRKIYHNEIGRNKITYDDELEIKRLNNSKHDLW